MNKKLEDNLSNLARNIFNAHIYKAKDKNEHEIRATFWKHFFAFSDYEDPLRDFLKGEESERLKEEHVDRAKQQAALQAWLILLNRKFDCISFPYALAFYDNDRIYELHEDNIEIVESNFKREIYLRWSKRLHQNNDFNASDFIKEASDVLNETELTAYSILKSIEEANAHKERYAYNFISCFLDSLEDYADRLFCLNFQEDTSKKVEKMIREARRKAKAKLQASLDEAQAPTPSDAH